MKYEITDSIYTKHIYKIVCIDYISFGFTHLAIALQQPRMTKYLLRQRLTQSHENDRPVNCMETDNILSDQMEICRPELLIKILSILIEAVLSVHIITETGDIVAERIKPYIYYMIRIEIYRDTPFERGSGYTQILQSRKKEVVHHLVFAGLRLNKLRMCIDMLDQPVCIFAELQEICLLLCRLAWTSAVRTLSIHQLGLCKEGLARCTVHALIKSLINVALIIKLFEDLLYLLLMILVRRTDKTVIRRIHQIPDCLDLPGNIIYEFLWCDSGFLCLQLDLLAMLIRSCLKTYIISLLSLETHDTVCQNGFICVTDMWFS